MRLLRTIESVTGNFEIKEFQDNQITQYAILSHFWQDEEVTLQDVETGRSAKKKGYEKIKKSCSQAMADGLEYMWIDTCCIDKTSSAELSEAINSMYRWYQEASVCYAYLADVPSEAEFSKANFCFSRWFTRGWALQELIAPLTVIFFDREWKKLGTKESLQHFISDRTGIPSNILLGEDLEKASIAQRMSWAAHRETTRIEDRAYCLLGIFGINMPLLYGEGEKAFIRLQQEILRVSDDHSLFAWRASDSNNGLLATTPAAFLDSGKIVPCIHFNASTTPSTISSKGITLELRFIGIGNRGLGFAILDCTEIGNEDRCIAIYLKDVLLTMENFERVQCETFELLSLRDFKPAQYPLRRIYVQQRRLIKRGVNVKPLRRERQEEAREELHLHSKFNKSQEMLINRRDFTTDTEQERKGKKEGLSSYRETKANVNVNDGLRSLLDITPDEDETAIEQLLTRSDIEADKTDSAKRTALSHAAGGGHEVVARLLLARRDVEADRKDSEGRTALSHAAGEGHEAVVRLLLARRDVEADSMDYRKRTVLSHAAGGGHESIVSLLLARRDVEANSVDKSNQTPVFHAAGNGHEDVVWLLLTRDDVDVNQQDLYGYTLLSATAIKGHTSLLKTLLARRGFEPNQIDGKERTPLSYAAEHGHEAVVKLLLEQGAITEFHHNPSLTPLLLAVDKGNETIVKLLIKHGANIEFKPGGGQTPLIYAARIGREAIAKLLIEHGANLMFKECIDEHTPLSVAVEYGHEAVVKLLLDLGPNLESKFVDGKTLLFHAAHYGHEAVVKLLLGRGASMESEDRYGMTPLSEAVRMGYKGVVKLLIEHGVNLEFKHSGGWTALFYAVKHDHQAIVELLLDAGANFRSKDEDNRTPIELASRRGPRTIFNMLKDRGADYKD